MRFRPRALVDSFLSATRLELLPVRVRHGMAAGAWWSLYPWTSYWRGRVEPEIDKAILALGDFEGKTCWDLGAHYGFYSIGLARLVGPAGQVAAFEPLPQNYRRACYHRRLNRLSQLLIFPFAVSDAEGIAELITYGQRESTTAHFQYRGEPRTADWEPVAVKKVRLDDFVRSGTIRPPWFVKIDVEGHAHRALAGMQDTLRQHRPRLSLAFHSEEEVTESTAILDPLGYRRTQIGTGGWSSHPLVGRDFMYLPAGH